MPFMLDIGKVTAKETIVLIFRRIMLMMNEKEHSEIEEVIKGIGHVDSLTLPQLVEISCKLFELTNLYECVIKETRIFDYTIKHTCNLFYHHNSQHTPMCSCCQTQMLLYYLGRCMDKLADSDKLPQYVDAHLSPAWIRDRTYGHIRKDSKLIFRINRHLNAWRNVTNMKEIIQTWQFDFRNLSLSEGVNTD
jgi:hypothetical protein